MKFGIFLFAIVSISFLRSQTLLLEENFNYGSTETDLVTASSSVWTNHSGGTGDDDVQYSLNGLTYSGYTSSGIAGSVSLTNSRTGDDNRTFSTQSTGSIYVSALVNVADATTSANGEYFLHFNTSTHYARLYVRKSSSSLLFGISKYNEGATFSGTNFTFNTTYLVVIKYTFNGAVEDDRIDLWVLSSGVPSTEVAAGTPNIENLTAANSDASSLSTISLRQGSTTFSVLVDGIRVSDSWTQAPLPVELSSFSASRIDEGVELNWITQTEVNNYGFEIERASSSTMPISGWENIGFVEGHGNSNSIKHYSFVDSKIELNKYSYRLKQIDNDGSFSYSKTIQVSIDAAMNYELSQNYPNPFNPTTSISFTIPDKGLVKLDLYNVLGQKVKSIINEIRKKGFYAVSIYANDLNSGIYFYRLEVNGRSLTRKMNLLK